MTVKVYKCKAAVVVEEKWEKERRRRQSVVEGTENRRKERYTLCVVL